MERVWQNKKKVKYKIKHVSVSWGLKKGEFIFLDWKMTKVLMLVITENSHTQQQNENPQRAPGR